MQGVIKGRVGAETYWLDGNEVTKAEFDRAFPDVNDTGPGAGSSFVGFRPLESEALAVHPDQIPEAIESAKRHGVPTEFTPSGLPIFTSSRHFRNYAKKYGFRHKGY